MKMKKIIEENETKVKIFIKRRKVNNINYYEGTKSPLKSVNNWGVCCYKPIFTLYTGIIRLSPGDAMNDLECMNNETLNKSSKLSLL